MHISTRVGEGNNCQTLPAIEKVRAVGERAGQYPPCDTGSESRKEQSWPSGENVIDGVETTKNKTPHDISLLGNNQRS